MAGTDDRSLLVLSGPEGLEPALGFFEKKTGLSHFGRDEQQAKQQQKFCPATSSPGVARTFFRFYYYFVNVTFSFPLRSRSGREARVKRIAARV